jgi:hypothetical protein
VRDARRAAAGGRRRRRSQRHWRRHLRPRKTRLPSGARRRRAAHSGGHAAANGQREARKHSLPQRWRAKKATLAARDVGKGRGQVMASLTEAVSRSCSAHLRSSV